VKFIGTSLEDLRGFPDAARQRVGRQLRKLQNGEEPYDWRPMTGIGPGVKELRIRVEGAHRIIYLTKTKNTVHVLHAFRKKSKKNAKT